jgi:hypothetical protein
MRSTDEGSHAGPLTLDSNGRGLPALVHAFGSSRACCKIRMLRSGGQMVTAVARGWSQPSPNPLPLMGEGKFSCCGFNPGRRLSDSPLPWATVTSLLRSFSLACCARRGCFDYGADVEVSPTGFRRDAESSCEKTFVILLADAIPPRCAQFFALCRSRYRFQ